jgi:hypothetical protein
MGHSILRCRLYEKCCCTWPLDMIIGFEVLTAVVVKTSIFWNITPCGSLKFDRRFGGTCHLHPLGRNRARNQVESRWQAEQILFIRRVCLRNSISLFGLLQVRAFPSDVSVLHCITPARRKYSYLHKLRVNYLKCWIRAGQRVWCKSCLTYTCRKQATDVLFLRASSQRASLQLVPMLMCGA